GQPGSLQNTDYLTVPSAGITRVPDWCMDVESRRKLMDAQHEQKTPLPVSPTSPWTVIPSEAAAAPLLSPPRGEGSALAATSASPAPATAGSAPSAPSAPA
ncbi:unnamed protein product, partial [Symbiodinium pilosum]